jgi:hypothetical protein
MKRPPSSKKRSRALVELQPERIKKKNPLLWLFEPFEDDPGFLQRKLFSFDAAYLDGRLYVAVNDGEEPWSGLLVCTSKEHHASLLSDFPQLAPHRVLKKWLYLSQRHPHFESVAIEMISLALQRDTRLGVESGSRARRSSKRI